MQFIAAASVWFFGFSLAHADGDRLRRVEFAKHRPANFYETIYSETAKICGPLLNSLNKEYKQGRPDDKKAVLQNEFIESGWKQGKYIWRQGDSAEGRVATWDVVVVDLNHDGAPEGVFRMRGHYGGGFDFETLYVESPAKPDVISGETLSLQRFQEIMGKPHHRLNGVAMNQVHLVTPWISPSQPNIQDLNAERFLEIVRIGNQYYILTANAFYWATQHLSKTLKVTLIQYRNPRDFVIKCQFKGTKTIVLK